MRDRCHSMLLLHARAHWLACAGSARYEPRDGHVRRTPSETDRRVQYIELTDGGLTQFQEMANQHEQWLVQLFAGLNSKDMNELTELLRKTQEGITP